MSGSEYDEGRRRGQQESNYSGSGRHADWAGWQQGHMEKERNAQQLRDSMAPQAGGGAPDYSRLFATGGGGLGGLLVLTALFGGALYWRYLLFALIACGAVAVVAALLAPLRPAVGRNVGGFRRNYFPMLLSLGAYVITFCGLVVALGLLGYATHAAWLGGFAILLDGVHNPLLFRLLRVHRLAWAIAVLQVPAIAAFVYAMHRAGVRQPSGRRGSGRVALSGIVLAGLAGTVTIALAYAIYWLL